MCFYSTAVAPFRGRNSSSAQDESALRSFLISARKAKIPVYLSVNVLGWAEGQNNGSIFKTYPDLQEIGQDPSEATEVTYASPFNRAVWTIMDAVLLEIGRKFPEATGVLLDLHLSRTEVLGFSKAARSASIRAISVDPVDVLPKGQVSISATDRLKKWIDWRKNVIALMFTSLRDSYHAGNPNGKLYAFGTVDYYVAGFVNDMRLSQNWLTWADEGVVDGILLGGQWASGHPDNALYRYMIPKAIAAKSGRKLDVIPVLKGTHLNPPVSYSDEWIPLSTYNSGLQEIALVVDSDADVQGVITLLTSSNKLEGSDGMEAPEK